MNQGTQTQKDQAHKPTETFATVAKRLGLSEKALKKFSLSGRGLSTSDQKNLMDDLGNDGWATLVNGN